MRLLVSLLLFWPFVVAPVRSLAFVPAPAGCRRCSGSGGRTAVARPSSSSSESEGPSSRRGLLRTTAASAIAAGLTMAFLPGAGPAVAAGEEAAVEMKDFVDPKGLFTIAVPKTFFTLRRSARGDLPDEKTGQGRRGSSIFTAGDMAKAEVVAVERFPARVLLEENGIEATGSLKTFPDLGEPAAIANLLSVRRDRDKPGTSSTKIVPDSLFVTSDGKELSFRLKTEIEAQKPELLMEQYGVSRLFRITTAKASLRSNDGNIMAAFGSALESDFNGPDGRALQSSINSFQALEQKM